MKPSSTHGVAPVEAPSNTRTVSLNLLARAREHVPYMGETWKALTEAMTSGVGADCSQTESRESPMPD